MTYPLTDKQSVANTRTILVLLFLALLLLVTFPGSSFAQNRSFSVTGNVTAVEKYEEEPLRGAHVQLLALPDSSLARGAATDQEGKFILRNVGPGDYLLRVTFLGFQAEIQSVKVDDRSVEGLVFHLQNTPFKMSEFEITARRLGVEARGDTTLFHADSYRSGQDPTAENMIRRMPGLTVENGRVHAQGEEVKRILVDGEEYFGEEATLFLRNLPPEMIKQIEVYDRPSDQAQFTGFNDGNTERTLNIVTHDGLNQGHFGRINSGYGTLDRYLTGGSYNFFDGPRRVTVVGMSNNVNQQNFSNEDLPGVSEASGSNVIGGSSNGITSVHSAGINYNDRWNDSWRINSSYFFNMGDQENDHNLERRYLTGLSANQIYSEDAYNTSDNFNHRFNVRLEHNIGDSRSLIINPRLSFQQYTRIRTLEGLTMDESSRLLNEINSKNLSNNTGYNIAGNVLYRHRFEKKGRTFSADLRTNMTDRTSNQSLYNESFYHGDIENSILSDQRREILTERNRFSGNLSYTEPVGKKSQLMFSYQPSIDWNTSIQDAFLIDEETWAYSVIDSTLSNRYENRIHTHRARSSYRFRHGKYSADASLSLQHTALSGEQVFPDVIENSQSWKNLLPATSFQVRFDKNANLHFSYQTSIQPPSARQLQDVIDNSNPLRVSAGNPDLNPQYNHRFSLRFRAADSEKGTSTIALLAMGYIQDRIGNQTFTAQRDSLLREGVVLGRGSRLISPDNIGSAWNARARLYRSVPFDMIQSNLDINAGVSFSRNPSIIDDDRFFSDNLGFSAEASANRFVNEQFDYHFSYLANYHLVGNSTRPDLTNKYYTGRATGGFNMMPWGGLLLASDLNLRHYNGMERTVSENTIYWNGSVGYQFLENRAAELRLTLFDILAQNNNNIIHRSISDDYIEEFWSNQLSRYFIMTFSYNFRSFGGKRTG